MKKLFTIAVLLIAAASLQAQDRSHMTFTRDGKTGKTVEVKGDRSHRGLVKLSNTRLDYALNRANYWSSRIERYNWKNFSRKMHRMAKHLSAMKMDGDWYATGRSDDRRKKGLVKIN